MKINYNQLNRRPSMNLGRQAVKSLKVFLVRLWQSIVMMTAFEKKAVAVLILLSLVLFSLKARNNYYANTVAQAAYGGAYKEAVVGDIKTINPIIANTDAERSASSLVFSGLVDINNEEIQPDVAESWEISSDGLKYTFFLKKNVFFHDGAQLTANDVNYTIEAIKTEGADGSKSPLHDAWKDVTVVVEDDHQISFKLPRPYGPFLLNADFGIVPAHLTNEELAKKYIGSGPFVFEKTVLSNNKIAELDLKRNEVYFKDKAFLSRILIKYFDQESEAVKAFDRKEVNALFGASSQRGDVYNLNYVSSKRMGLVVNLRNEKFADKEFRRKIVSGEKVNEPTKLRLVTLNLPIQQSYAEDLKKKMAEQDITLETIYLSALQMNDVLSSREFELLLYGFNYGHDRDPYVFWHSSQMDQRNFAGYSSKSSDILLEDARMMLDLTERNAKYDQFFEALGKEYVARFWESIKYTFSVDLSIKGVKPANGEDPSSRYDNITGWYVKEKRVKPE